MEGRDAITPVPADRYDIDRYFDPEPGVPGKIYSRWGGFLDRIDEFDSEFFGISRREADHMDPQQRLALEVSYEALEDAGLAGQLEGSETAIFVGLQSSDYEQQQARGLSDYDLFALTGSQRNAVAGRLAYSLRVHGPSMVVDSDRSSGLVAVHQACNSLRSGECDVALAGAVNLVLGPETTIAFSRGTLLALDGRCKFGDARADGFVRSEGVGFVVLKRYEQAIADGDVIRAVILGSAVNSDGGRGGHLLTPSRPAQEALVRRACRNAGVSPGELGYVEAHGTGTPVGDSVEIQALGAALADGRGPGAPAYVGSVKTNIGHTEACAGIAGLLKVILSLKGGVIPQSLHFERPNPAIPFDKLPVVVPTAPVAWPQGRRIAGVSSFGFTGTNAHVIVEAPPAAAPAASQAAPAGPMVLAISAAAPEALVALGQRYAGALAELDGADALRDLCHNAAVRRPHQRHRLAVVGGSAAEMREALATWAEGGNSESVVTNEIVAAAPRVVLVFPGQGAQWAGMGRQLARVEPVFRAKLAECSAAIARHTGWSLIDDDLDARINENDVMQPALFAMGVSLAALWRSWGVTPTSVVGHSMGEVIAAHVAGALELDDAAAVICHRSRLMMRVDGRGGMAVAELTVEQAELEIADLPDLCVAGLNSPTSTVVAGTPASVKTFVERLKARGVMSGVVRTGVAGHSAHMDELMDELAAKLAGIRPRATEVPLVSTVTGGPIDGASLDAGHWVRNLRRPVLFWPAIRELLGSGHDLFIESSPHPVLRSALLDSIDHLGKRAAVLSSLNRKTPEHATLLGALGGFYAAGGRPAWDRLFPTRVRPVRLPTYAWHRERHWFVADRTVDAAADAPRARAEGPAAPRRESRAAASLVEQLAAAGPDERRGLIARLVKGQLARVLGVKDPESIDVTRPIVELGVKSLMTLELRNAIGRALERKLPATLFFNYGTVDAVTDHLAEEIGGKQAPPGHPPSNIGEILLECGIIDRRQLQLAVAEQQRGRSHERLGEILIRLGFLSPRDLQAGLLRQLAEPIAVIGMACRLPGGVDSPEQYWRLLAAGRDGIVDVPADRWPHGGRGLRGGFLEGVDRFDARFFGIAPREARAMDPQHRLLLEVAWEALENAGQSPERLAGSRTGVFVAMMNNNDYAVRKRLADQLDKVTAHDAIGDAMSIAAGRLSYLLDLRGPTATVDTACSSSLVAIHNACQALRNGESRMMLVGGVNLMLMPNMSVAFGKAGMLSPEGTCKSFDAAADGYARGEGCGVVVLKRLSHAIDDRDNVLAVLVGSAVNHNGRSNGLTAPNGLAQREVIAEALRVGGVDPAQVSYVEAQGTGTPLGDSIELEALGAVLSARPRDRVLHIGTAKPNLGHLEAASGMAALIKVVLAMQHRQIPPNLNLKTTNPDIHLERIPAKVPTELTAWDGDGPRIAGISAFGFSGTNAHVVVQAATQVGSTPEAATRLALSHYPFVLSARSAEALTALAGRYADHLEARPDLSLADACFTAATGRSHFEHRLALAAASRADLIARLREPGSARVHRGVVEADKGVSLAFLFADPGRPLGAQAGLYAALPVYWGAIQRCAEIAGPILRRPLLDVLSPDSPDPDLDELDLVEPALFATEYALATLWRSRGVVPAAVLGHGVGEYVAACVAGALSLEDALRLVARRAQLLRRLPRVSRLAADASPDALQHMLDAAGSALSIASIDGARRTVLAGSAEAIADAAARLAAEGVVTRPRPTTHTPHPRGAEAILDEFDRLAAEVKPSVPTIAWVSGVTGERMPTDRAHQPSHWRHHLCQPVRFADGVRALGCDLFLEIGPQQGLDELARAVLPGNGRTFIGGLRPGHDGAEQMSGALAAMYVAGVPVDWHAAYDRVDGRRAWLPTYPFERERFWLDESEAAAPPQVTPSAPEEAPARPPWIVELEGTSQARRRDRLFDLIRGEIAAILGSPVDRVGRRDRFMEIGLNSFLALELRTRLSTALGRGIKLPATLIYDYPTSEALGHMIAGQLEALEFRRLQATPPPPAAVAETELSEEEAAELLAEELSSLRTSWLANADEPKG